MLIIDVCGEITLFDGRILFLCIKKIMLYCSGAVACGQVPCKRAESFVPCECDKSACVLRSTKCHLSLQLHPFLLFVFLLCSFNWKEKKKLECMKKGNDAIRAITLHLREKILHYISWLKDMRTSWKVIGHLLLKYSGISH